jgi:hypothetical protein
MITRRSFLTALGLAPLLGLAKRLPAAPTPQTDLPLANVRESKSTLDWQERIWIQRSNDTAVWIEDDDPIVFCARDMANHMERMKDRVIIESLSNPD